MVSSTIRSYFALEKEYVIMAAPICFLVTVQMSVGFITLVFAGLIDQQTLAGTGLGNTFYNVFQYSAMYGYSSIMDTFGPQVYGSNQKKHLGTVLLKVISQGVLVWLIILGPYLNLVYLMRVVTSYVQPGEEGGYELVIEKSVLYLRITCCLGLLDYVYGVLSKYLTIQNRMKTVYCSATVMVGSHILFNYLLTVRLNHGVYGLALACILTRLTTVLFVCLYVIYKHSSLAWAGFSHLVFVNWSEMIKLGVSGAINVSTEFGMYEISTFFSQFDGITTLNTTLIFFQYSGIPYAFSMGIAYSASVLLGKSLANQNTESTSTAIKIRNLAIFNVTLTGLTIAFLMFGFRFEMAKVFTKDEDVITLTASVMWIAAITAPFENLQTCLSRGILTALGRQRFIAVVLAVICYGICTPYIIATVFLTDLGAKGILSGFLLFAVLATCVYGISIARVDFDDEIERVKERISLTTGNIKKVGIDGAVFMTTDSLGDGECNGMELYLDHNNGGDTLSLRDSVSESDEHDDTVNLLVKKNNSSSKYHSSLVLRKLLLYLPAVVWAGVLAGVSFLKD